MGEDVENGNAFGSGVDTRDQSLVISMDVTDGPSTDNIGVSKPQATCGWVAPSLEVYISATSVSVYVHRGFQSFFCLSQNMTWQSADLLIQLRPVQGGDLMAENKAYFQEARCAGG